MTATYNPPAAESDYLIERLWQRFCRLAEAAGQRVPNTTQLFARRGFLVNRAVHVPGWYFDNVLEAATIGHDRPPFFRPRPAGRPTAAMQGSREKMEVIARRVLNGEELWHAEDGPFGIAGSPR